MSELLPCPFCGAKDHILMRTNNILKWMECMSCFACGPKTKRTMELGLWNTRAEDPVRAELVEALGHLLEICEDYDGTNESEQKIYRASLLFAKAKGEPL